MLKKIRGIQLNFDADNLLTFERMRSLVLQTYRLPLILYAKSNQYHMEFRIATDQVQGDDNDEVGGVKIHNLNFHRLDAINLDEFLHEKPKKSIA